MTWTTRPRSELSGLAAITVGKGPRVLLLHGVGLRAESWGAQLESIRAAHHVIAPDLPGHGHSPALGNSQPDLADYTTTLAKLLSSPTIVIGHSFGALLALTLAAHHPEKVSSVVALNAIFRRSPAAKTAVQTRLASLQETATSDPTDTLTRWFGTQDSAARRACHTWLMQANPRGYKAAYSVFAHEDGPSDSTLHRVRCPAFFVTGSEEPNSTPTMSHQMAQMVPQGEAVVIAGAAHMMPMTHATALDPVLHRALKAGLCQ
ncbi:alpha/beta hydrolase [uncultured Lentibacter sp.]|uniref:alpha/beta fold hydrolase n=1 Tax=uncultured Lentibacter sp. TaxID=1659309 RepID=UPI0026215113|nr:alpha/beta hydrolase [uncultured Lentibacter sp.]